MLQMRGHEGDHLATDLKVQDIPVEMESVQTPHLETHMPLDDVSDLHPSWRGHHDSAPSGPAVPGVTGEDVLAVGHQPVRQEASLLARHAWPVAAVLAMVGGRPAAA